MKTSVYQISFVGIVGTFLIYLYTNKKLPMLKNLFLEQKNILFAFGFILVSMTTSNALSPVATLDSWSAEFQYLFRYFFMFAILLLFHKEDIFSKKFIVIAILLSLFIQGIDGIYQSLFEVDFIKNNAGSLSEGLSGATFNRNNFCFFMSIGASICTGLLFYSKEYKLEKIHITTLITLLSVFLFNLLFSYSRASWLFYSVFSFILFAVEYKRISNKHFVFFLIIILLTALIFFHFDDLFLRLYQLIKLNDGGRYPIWHDVLHLIKENFIFGYGLMTYQYIASQPILSVHNSVLEILLFLGIVGFIAFTALLYFILDAIIKAKNYFYLAFFCAFLVISQFDNSIIKGITSLSTLSIFAFFIFAKETNKE